jgi:hypothetical protein
VQFAHTTAQRTHLCIDQRVRVFVIAHMFGEETRREAIEMAIHVAPGMTLIANVLEEARKQRRW